ncbi:MAG: transglutaminase family protein [Anaerovoracaceae bacterium]
MIKKQIAVFVAGIMCAAMFWGVCGTAQSEAKMNADQLPLANSTASILTPTASGKTVYTGESVTLDASNASQGYVMAKYDGSNQKIKIQITKAKGTTYTYNINSRKAYEVFPLTEGNGVYSVKVFENLSGTKYAQVFAQDINVTLTNQYLPFLYPNQYVNFTANSEVVKKAADITSKLTDDITKVEAIYDYTVDNFTYDTAKANSVQSGYLPNVDSILKSKKGICFDYAAVMASMLRSQNIPCKLVVGYTGDVYHAWINVYTEETGWVDGMIFFDGKKWQMMDPTFASSGKKSEAILKYISNPSNYQAKYAY